MNERCFVGTMPVDAIPGTDRGFAYGDGLFETMRAHRGTIPWWEAHWARLTTGAARLRIALPDPAQVAAEAHALLAGADGVLKLVVSRGTGGRGYGPPETPTPTWVLSRHALPATPDGGLAVRWCETRLAVQPALAGLKHCNRLEQVLARAEWPQAPTSGQLAQEGLMRSAEGDVVCATAANLFVLHGTHWLTPPVDRCGVAGICRQWLLGATGAEQSLIEVAAVEDADAVFLCNAVRGILPVARLGTRSWPLHEQVAVLQQRLADAHPGFAVVDFPS